MAPNKNKQNNKFREPEMEKDNSVSGSSASTEKGEHLLTRDAPPRKDTAKEKRGVEAYVERLRSEGKKVPGHPLFKKWPNYPHIASESGVALNTITNKKTTEHKQLSEAVADLGLDPYIHNAIRKVITFGGLMEYGSEKRKDELKGKESLGQQLSNTRTALNKLIGELGKTIDDVVGQELLDDEVLSQVADSIEKESTHRKFLGEIKRWGEYYLGLLQDADLPPEFPLALSVAIVESGKSLNRVAKESGAGCRVIEDWVKGRSHPSQNSYTTILEIEKVLGLSLGSLLSRVKRVMVRRLKGEDYPEFVTINGEQVRVRGNESILRDLRPILPDDYVQCPMTEREEMVKWLIEHLIMSATDWALRNKEWTRKPYALKSVDSGFTFSDLLNPVGLLNTLRTGSDHISVRFMSALTPEVKKLVKKYDVSSPLPQELRKPLVKGLNSLLKGPALIDESLLPSGTLSREIQDLLRQNPHNKELVHLNRLILEAVFPQEIARRHRFSLEFERVWEELARYKFADVQDTDIKRSKDAGWSPASERLYKEGMSRMLGMLTLPKIASDTEMTGPGLDPKDFSLVMLASTRFARDWINWLAGRRAVNKPDDEYEDEMHEREDLRKVYTSYDLMYVQFLCSLFRSETGWLRQRKDLLNHLQVIPGYIEKSFIDRAKKNWDAVCDEAFASYTNIAENLQAKVEITRDPFEQILPILESENPLEAMKLFANNIWNDIPDVSLAPMRAATRYRNYLIVRILGVTAFRSKQIRQLLYKDDNTGELRKENGNWVIEISYRKFKNKHSSFFGKGKNKRNYRKVLKDSDGLYDRIEEYIAVHREILLKGRISSIFFVSTGKTAIIPKESFTHLYRRLTMIYLAHNPYRNSGWPGVKPHHAHAVRDMMATHVIKKTGDPRRAADSIQDISSTTERHYARFIPADKIRMVDDIINDVWD